jgi:hypothetical protein
MTTSRTDLRPEALYVEIECAKVPSNMTRKIRPYLVQDVGVASLNLSLQDSEPQLLGFNGLLRLAL